MTQSGLLQALGKSERAHNCDQEAHLVAALLVSQLEAGRQGAARAWWHWSARLRAGPLSPDARLRLLAAMVHAGVWLELPDLSAELRLALSSARAGYPRDQALAALTEHLLDHGDLDAAEVTGRAWWLGLSSRESLAAGASLYVRLLRVTGHQREARMEAETAVHLSAGLSGGPVLHAALAQQMALSADDPSGALVGLELLQTPELAPLNSPLHLQMTAYRALAHQRLGQTPDAQSLLREAGLSPLRLRTRLGLQPEEAAMLAPPPVLLRPRSAVPELQLEFLGLPSLRLRGFRLKLRPRFADLLVALALHPDGLTGEQLALSIYGEDGNSNCCKTELSRLRQLLPVGTRPYRLMAHLSADFLEFPALLSQGLTRAGLDLYRGPLLRGSDAPVVREQREWLEELLRQQVLDSPDPDLSWQAAAHFPDDQQVWECLLGRLHRHDPRQHEAAAHVAVLSRAAAARM